MRKSMLLGFLLNLSVAVGLLAEPIKVVSFSAILSEVASEVGGDAVQVIGLVKPGMDPHGYQPTPADLKQLADARLVLVSGKHLEPYVDKVARLAPAGSVVLEVGDQVPSLAAPEGGHDHDHSHGASECEHSEVDPHWWNSVANMRRAVIVVRDALIAIAPEDKEKFNQNAAAYRERLAGLDKWIRQQVALLPRDQRKLVTSHDALQYFARDYGFMIEAIEGLSTEQEASAGRVQELIGIVRKEGVKAVFFEDTLNPKVTKEITRETGARIGGMLYADGPGTDAPTYEQMQRHNVTTIVEAVR